MTQLEPQCATQVPEQHLGAESSLHPFTAVEPSSSARPAQSRSTPGQATEQAPPGRPGVLDSSLAVVSQGFVPWQPPVDSSLAIANQGFVPWRAPVMLHDSQPGEAQAASTVYWRHAVCSPLPPPPPPPPPPASSRCYVAWQCLYTIHCIHAWTELQLVSMLPDADSTCTWDVWVVA